MIKQASGVMKVIVVISIEMLLFPLYCGLLLDAALLPLFENATVMSRVMFTCNYPITSVFVHWFVGTGYMFHFALFVSMCRKVMRRGVLYFIRDPDDPEFHPVRDVLERSLVAQLRKILFSAFVYGALVIVCLGGVVWGLWYALPSLLPIHYSSNEPVLEFPIDLLFYNFAMPVAVRFFKPSDSLHAMYTWWFRKCARGLRLTWFLFGERRIDEEGTLVLAENSEHRRLPWWRTVVLEVHDGKVVPMRWDAVLDGGSKLPLPPIKQAAFVSSASAKRTLVESGQLIPSGRLVRTPASDQIKIQRGMRVFRSAADVDDAAANGTVDKLPPDAFSADVYQLAYVPPRFGLRIFLFILFIWLFAASTGVGLTIVPLVFGRWVFKAMIPSHIRTNDIYAFSIGIYTLGSVAYAACHLRSVATKTRDWIVSTVSSWLTPEAPARFAAGMLRTSRLVYAYSTLLILLPLLTAAMMELYVIVPLHTVMHRPAAQDGGVQTTNDGRHTVRVIQTWTLGVLYLKLGARLVSSWYEDTRLAMAIQAVMRNGMLEPDIGVLTRVFVVPGVTLGCLALFGPVLATRGILARGYFAQYADTPASLAVVHRLAYPMAALILWAIWMNWKVMAVFNRWTVHIRDEAYLIGERLHNFGVTSTSPARARATDWRAGANRL
jgi:E3 ubiquitin-protein ligase MARCH6